jgi:hypothetical protein
MKHVSQDPDISLRAYSTAPAGMGRFLASWVMRAKTGGKNCQQKI